MPVWRARVDASEWRTVCREVRDKGGRLVALWGADDRDRRRGFTVHAALSVQSGLVILALPVDGRMVSRTCPTFSRGEPDAARGARSARA